MNIKQLSVFLGCLAAPLANPIARSSQSALIEPRRAIIAFISTSPPWMKVSGDVFRSPFTVTLFIAKHMLRFIFTIANISPSNWLSAIGAWRTTARSLLLNIFPIGFLTALHRARLYIFFQRALINKFFTAISANSCFCSTFITKNSICFAVKKFPAFPANALRILAFRHISLPFESVPYLGFGHPYGVGFVNG